MSAKLDARIDIIDAGIGAFIPEVEPAERSRLFATWAIGEKEDLERRQWGSKPPPVTTMVDGKEGASEFSVKPDGGVIAYEWQVLGDVFTLIEAELIRNSVVGKATDKRPGHPGMFQKSHDFMADGTPANPANPPMAAEWIFQSLVPYSRKLEKRYNLYELTADWAADRFGNQFRIWMAYRATAGGTATRAERITANESRMPALVIRPR